MRPTHSLESFLSTSIFSEELLLSEPQTLGVFLLLLYIAKQLHGNSKYTQYRFSLECLQLNFYENIKTLEFDKYELQPCDEIDWRVDSSTRALHDLRVLKEVWSNLTRRFTQSNELTVPIEFILKDEHDLVPWLDATIVQVGTYLIAKGLYTDSLISLQDEYMQKVSPLMRRPKKLSMSGTEDPFQGFPTIKKTDEEKSIRTTDSSPSLTGSAGSSDFGTRQDNVNPHQLFPKGGKQEQKSGTQPSPCCNVM